MTVNDRNEQSEAVAEQDPTESPGEAPVALDYARVDADITRIPRIAVHYSALVRIAAIALCTLGGLYALSLVLKYTATPPHATEPHPGPLMTLLDLALLLASLFSLILVLVRIAMLNHAMGLTPLLNGALLLLMLPHPLLSVAILLTVSHVAYRRLRRVGVRVGLLGVPRAELDRLARHEASLCNEA